MTEADVMRAACGAIGDRLPALDKLFAEAANAEFAAGQLAYPGATTALVEWDAAYLRVLLTRLAFLQALETALAGVKHVEG